MRVITFCILMSLTVSCSPEHIAAAKVDDQTAAGAARFEKVRAAIFSPRCASCHSQYGTYAGVKRNLDAIADSIFADRMPKASQPLSAELKTLLRDWMASEKSGPAQLEPTWASLFENVFQGKCVICHNPAGSAKFLDLSSRNEIFAARNRVFANGKKLVNLDLPAESYLLDVIQDPVEPMPPTWSNIRRLNTDELRVLTEWIGLGLP